MGVRQGGPLREEVAGLLHNRGDLAEQHGMASQAEDKIGQAPIGKHFDDFWGGAMTVSADEDRGVGPVASERGQEPDQAHGMLRTGGTLPRSKARGHQGVGGPCENEEGQRAIAAVGMVIERACLWAVCRVLSVIEVEDKGGGGLGGARNAVMDERLCEPIELGAGRTVLKPGEGRGTRQGLRRLQR
jgi:hypothetical protein